MQKKFANGGGPAKQHAKQVQPDISAKKGQWQPNNYCKNRRACNSTCKTSHLNTNNNKENCKRKITCKN